MNCMVTRKPSCGQRAVPEAKWNPTARLMCLLQEDKKSVKDEQRMMGQMEHQESCSRLSMQRKCISMALHASHQVDLSDWTEE